jgi:hypothetical protein
MFAFRNDESGSIGTFLAPMFGAGMDLIEIARALLEHFHKPPGDLAKLVKLMAEKRWSAFFKELLKDLTFDLSWNPTDFQKANVYVPLTLHKLDGAGIGTISANLGYKHQYQYLYVSGHTWYTERSGKRMFAMRDFLDVPASWGIQFQFPNVAGSFLGGPLLLL